MAKKKVGWGAGIRWTSAVLVYQTAAADAMELGNTELQQLPWLTSTHPWASGLLIPATDCRPGMAAAPKQPESPMGLTSHRLALVNTRKCDGGGTVCLSKGHADCTQDITAALPHLLGFILKPALYSCARAQSQPLPLWQGV